MIKVKAIFGKLFEQLSDENIFNNANLTDTSHFQCPYCHRKGDFKKLPSYQRYMISYNGDSRTEVLVTIPRIQCPSCGHTHALIPDNLIPYGSYTIKFVLRILLEYLKRKTSVEALCNKWNISISTLYEWKKIFLYHHSLLLGVIHAAKALCESLINEVYDYPDFPFEFFDCFRFSFLQIATYSRTGP